MSLKFQHQHSTTPRLLDKYMPLERCLVAASSFADLQLPRKTQCSPPLTQMALALGEIHVSQSDLTMAEETYAKP